MFATRHQDSVSTLRAGGWVTIRHATEIEALLDENGCTGGIQFMPNMVAYAGRSFRIRRFANKLCAQTDDGAAIFGLEDAVILDVPRCGGDDHGGCQMGCELLWHASWLVAGKLPLEQREEAPPIGADEIEVKLLRACRRSREEADECVYQCQATSIRPKLYPLPPTRISQYYVDVFQNPRGLSRFAEFAKSLVLRRLGVVRDVCGDLTRTPRDDLGVQVGESVRVKPLAAIQKTLDGKGCNRGLWFDTPAMVPYCGKEMVVSRRILRMIDERTGKLILLRQPAIVLAEAACDGLHRRFCSRGSLLFWREVWLERTTS